MQPLSWSASVKCSFPLSINKGHVLSALSKYGCGSGLLLQLLCCAVPDGNYGILRSKPASEEGVYLNAIQPPILHKS